MKQPQRSLIGAMVATASLCAVFNAAPVKAEPRIVQPEPRRPTFDLNDQASLAKALALTKMEELSRTPLTLKVTNVTLEGLIAEIQRSLPEAKIEVREARPVKLSFDLPTTQTGQILQSAAGLAGCELYLLPGRMLIAPRGTLTKAELAERFQWTPGTRIYTALPLAKKFIEDIVTSIHYQLEANAPAGAPNGTVLFGSLTAEQKEMIRCLGRWDMYGKPAAMPPVMLAPDTKVSISFNPNRFTLDLDPSRAALSPNQPSTSSSYSVVSDR